MSRVTKFFVVHCASSAAPAKSSTMSVVGPPAGSKTTVPYVKRRAADVPSVAMPAAFPVVGCSTYVCPVHEARTPEVPKKDSAPVAKPPAA